MSKFGKGNKHWNWQGGLIKKICLTCQKEYFVKRGRYKKSHYCSFTCRIPWNTGLEGWSAKEQNGNWKGGISPEREAVYSSAKWLNLVKKIYSRDENKCRLCGKEKEIQDKYKFHVHHISSFKNRILRYDLNNLVLLCNQCHFFVHSKKNEKHLFIRD